ncbi:hypothetical protein N7G274_000698 [Stereocaulon virgatum]|uniref:Uncharacterized protein n=1 Tax=Stereocaulon virgatum TaxID=373712 RepID=A0ABR4AS99_9LECA
MWCPSSDAASQAQYANIPFVGNILHTSFHTQRAREMYAWYNKGSRSWRGYQDHTLCVMMRCVLSGRTLVWLPIVIAIIDEFAAIRKTIEDAVELGSRPLRVQKLEVLWKANGNETIAGMPSDTMTSLCEDNVAATVHKLKQRSGLDSMLVTMERAPASIIYLTSEELEVNATSIVPRIAWDTSSSSMGKAPQDRPAQSERPQNSTSQKVAKSALTSTSGGIEAGRSAGNSNQAPICREQPSTSEAPESSNNTGGKETDQRTAAKRKRQASLVSEANEVSRQALSTPSVEGRDKRPYDPVRDMAG